MTFSEFGRRIKANDSTGTDHGTAAPLFVFGECIDGGILGNNPTINDTVTNDEGVAMQYDFRSIYASLLIDWFEVSPSVVSQMLFKDFQKLPIISGSCLSTGIEDVNRDFALRLDNYPNPALDYTIIHFETKNEFIRMSLFDSIGSELKVLFSGKINEGAHQIRLDTSELPVGNYVIRISNDQAQKTKILSKFER
ncbi:MAG: T9SS type A sorting domain-containing protein [Saprospiraceae bacterium]|nr:T9SS type A sorting domain-containing protein [Candidatus Vicinibacter affinis]